MVGHQDNHKMGYNTVAARAAIDRTPGTAGGGESGGGERPEPVETTHGKGSPGGQTDPAYRGGDNPNAPRKSVGSDAQ